MKILKSKKDLKGYIGFTKDLKNRFILHNSGKVQSTAPRRPFELVYYEAYKNITDAKNREFQLKRGTKSYSLLRRRIINSLN
jgi:putative endonuclease